MMPSRMRNNGAFNERGRRFNLRPLSFMENLTIIIKENIGLVLFGRF